MMRRVQSFSDDRFKGFCVHCGGPNETVDHNPSKVFLDEPFPPDLPASPACVACNNGFSPDEAYLACLVECAATGKLEPEDIERSKVAGLLRRDGRLRGEMRAARQETATGLTWQADVERVQRVVLKLARGHAAFEIEPKLDMPSELIILPLHLLPEKHRRDFEEDDSGVVDVWPELGSRAMNRMFVGMEGNEWLVVQDGRYRYKVTWTDNIVVRLVIREYLAAVVVWQ